MKKLMVVIVALSTMTVGCSGMNVRGENLKTDQYRFLKQARAAEKENAAQFAEWDKYVSDDTTIIEFFDANGRLISRGVAK